MGASSPRFTPAPQGPEKQHARCRAAGVDSHIDHGSFPSWFEGLMKLIRRGVECGNENREFGALPKSSLDWRRTPRIPDEDRQHRVFTDMSAFADEILDCFKILRTEAGNQPVQERAEKARGMLRRKNPGRADKNKRHPNRHQQPIECGTKRGHAGCKQRHRLNSMRKEEPISEGRYFNFDSTQRIILSRAVSSPRSRLQSSSAFAISCSEN